VYRIELELAFAWLPISPMRGSKAARRDVVLEVGRRAAGKMRSLWQLAEGLAGERAGPAVRG
jgi:hypothetical protein